MSKARDIADSNLDDLTVDTNTLHVDSTNNRVGIGTATPSQTLDVAGKITANSWQGRANTATPSTTDAFIHRPADNTLALGTASTERMRITSSGKLGIGTSSPASFAHIYNSGTGGTNFLSLENGSNKYDFRLNGSSLHIRDGSNDRVTLDSSGNVGIGTTPASGVRLDMRSNAAANSVDIRNSHASGFGLYTAAGSTSSQYALRAADSSNNSLFTVQSDGKVGIGTTSPDTKLTLAYNLNGSSEGLKLTSATRTTTEDSSSAIEVIGNSNYGTVFNVQMDGQIQLSPRGNEALRIDTSGDVLIGTTSAYGTNVLNVNGGIAIDGRNASTPGLCEKGDTDTGVWWPAANTLAVSTGGTERMRIDSSGRVGIGTSSPAQLLHLRSATPAIEFDDSGFATVRGRIYSNEGNLLLEADYNNSRNSSNIAFNIDGSERMRIDSSGRVGIGETNPDGLLHLKGDTNSNGAELYLQVNNNNTTDNLGAIHFGNNVDSTLSKIRGGTSGSSTSSYLSFSTSNTGSTSEGMRIDNTGRVTFRGNNTAVQSNSYGVFINATRSNGNTNGAVLGGIMVGYSGGNYGGIGYGLQPSSTSGRYISIVNDYHSFLDFTAGGFKTYTTTTTRTTNSQLDFADELIAGPYVNRGAGSWTSSSDERLKQNISEISQTTAYDHVKTARAVQYNWKYGSNTSQDYIGFIAQDWETNYPEVVTTEDDAVHGVSDPKGIRYTETVPVLMAALKEAITKIETLETKVSVLEGN